ncbi:MAG: 4-alpha-glucanotransferase [Bacillota bacterium]
MELTRDSGILLHPTSLPGKYGIGTLGSGAYQFIDFLAAADQNLWQVLPLGPVGDGGSPYQSYSAFAGNPLLIDLEQLVELGLLEPSDLTTADEFVATDVDYKQVANFKEPLLKKAEQNFTTQASQKEQQKFEKFCQENEYWLADYALFRALKDHFNQRSWLEWPSEIKLRQQEALVEYRQKLIAEIEYYKFVQYLFFKQWSALKDYAAQKEIEIIGDLPIFVALDSADVWSNPDLFALNDKQEPINVAGVPPDYFSETGQLWGNPLYDWSKHKQNGYQWWINRFKKSLELVDIVRLDHFRGFEAYWAVPFGEQTAVNGEWKPGPGADFLQQVQDELGSLPIIAEDLGVITEEVKQLRDDFELPGMQILQFGFESQTDNEHLPHNFASNSVVYTGTHDNNTILGWYQQLSVEIKKYAVDYLNINEGINWGFIRAAWSSTAKLAIVPLQDVLALGSGARMNVPGTVGDNWQWRYRSEMLREEHASRLKELTELYYR